MRSIHLNPGVYATIDHDAAVLLDLRRDRYFTIVLGDAQRAADRLSAASEQLVGAQLASLHAPPLDIAAIAEVQSEARLVAWPHIPPFFASCLWARKAVSKRRIDLALAQLARAAAKAPCAALEEREVWRVQERFERLRPFFPGDRVCLFDSLALAWFGLSQSLRPELVFGVRVRPFSAHCWLEWRGLVLNDRYGHAQSYKPILRAQL